jgi:heme A synthase
MNTGNHHRAFLLTTIWTLGLLFLGSVVHATESSLACPDWPTCFGTMVPEMTGGVFWEHLHRLVAGGLILFYCGALYLTWKEKPRYSWITRAAWAGLGLLLVQALFGGLTVLLLLPDWISTSHLGLAFLFLALATVLAVVSSPSWRFESESKEDPHLRLSRAAIGGAVLTFTQSLLGAAVRHTDAGVACPDVPLCLGQWIPTLAHPLVILHFSHRLLGLALMGVVLFVGHIAFWHGGNPGIRKLGLAVASVVVAQVLVGFLSVYYGLAVVPVSLHTLLAATLLTLLVTLVTLTRSSGGGRGAHGFGGTD